MSLCLAPTTRTISHTLLRRSTLRVSPPSPVRERRLHLSCRNRSPRDSSRTLGQVLTQRHIRKSAINWSSLVVYLAVGASVGLVVGLYRGTSPSRDGSPDAAHRAVEVREEFEEDMAVQLPKGRPGTLTPEEEAKLRELWHLMLQVSGIASPAPHTPNGASSQSPALSRTTSASEGTPEKKKKSRLSFLKKKTKLDETSQASSTSAPAAQSTPASVADIADGVGDDKHGTASAFKAALAESTPAEIHEAFWGMVKHDHPDALLLRFLRARKWDVNAALVMAISALHWRLVEAKVDSDIMINGEEGMLKWAHSSGAQAKEGGDFMAQIRMGKSFLHGRDKEGRPICYVRVRLHKPGQECEEAIERFTVYTIETARMFLRPPIDTATVVFDMTDFGMANMDYAPVKFMIKCFEANYPESLGVVLVHNAPWIFNTVWKIIKGWLDPVVASKIHFTNHLKDVEEFIDKSSIIKELGGPLEWKYAYTEPIEGENMFMEDAEGRQRLETERTELAKEYESVVLEWIASRPSTSRNGSPAPTPTQEADALRQRRDQVAAKLRSNYWHLDPYVRARSIYDRIGELRADTSSSGVSQPAAQAALSVPSSGENSARPSVDSVAQSFYTTRENWEDDVD